MFPKIFVDTNVLVYAHDEDAAQKREIAVKILDKLWSEKRGVLSLQVLQEFYVVLTKKIDRKNPLKTALEILRDYSVWEVVTMQVEDLIQAAELQKKHQTSFWDSLIIRAAQMADCSILLSEDFQAGRWIDNLEIVNPFSGKASLHLI